MTSRRLWVLGIDPGVTTGIGLLQIDGDRVEAIAWAAHGNSASPCAGGDAFRVLLSTHALVGEACIVGIEGQFIPSRAGLGQGSRGHAVSALKTAHHAGGWIYIAQMMGWRLYGGEPIAPNTWRQAVYGGHRVRRSEEYKRAAREQVGYLFGADCGTHHEAEALLIAWYVARELMTRIVAEHHGE